MIDAIERTGTRIVDHIGQGKHETSNIGIEVSCSSVMCHKSITYQRQLEWRGYWFYELPGRSA